MSHTKRFAFGGLGGLLPVLVSLLAIDVSSLIDHAGVLTLGVYVGYLIRVLVLFFLGGIMALLNSDVTQPLTLVQLGIAAPALIAAYINGSTVAGRDTKLHNSISFFSTAYAADNSNATMVVAGGFIGDVIDGATKNLGSVADSQQKKMATGPKQVPIDEQRSAHFRILGVSVINTKDKTCWNLTYGSYESDAENNKTVLSAKKAFPPPMYEVQGFLCEGTGIFP